MSYLENCQYSDRLIKKLKQLDVKGQLDFALIEKAIIWAKKYHHGQFRKTGEPYYTHPLEVAYMVADYLLNTDIIIASILHDTIEDTTLTYEMIEQEFSPKVAIRVYDLTRVVSSCGLKMSAAEIMLKLAQQNKWDTAIIKLCDRIHNLQTTGVLNPQKIKKILNETIKDFLVCSIYIENNNLEQILIKSCLNISNSIEKIQNQLIEQEDFVF